jgi:hypothetical protein
MPDVVYCDALKLLNIKPMENQHENLCGNLFRSVMLNTNHKVCHLLPERHNSGHFLRNENNFNIPLIKTTRTKNSSLPCAISSISRMNMLAVILIFLM